MAGTATRAYAQGTTVDSSRSVKQIKDTLKRFGASEFAHFEGDEYVRLAFNIDIPENGKRFIRFDMILPSVHDERFHFVGVNGSTKKKRTDAQIRAEVEKEINRLYRALAEGIKGKLVLVESGIESVEQAFYANIVLPGNATVYEATAPQIATAYETKQVPALLPEIKAIERKVDG